MKSHLWILLLLFGVNFSAGAQSTETIKVSAGNDIAPAVSSYGIYRFPAFTSGIILLKNGNQGTELLNVNILSDQVVFIGKKGDTLAIGIPDQVKKISINGVNFYYDAKDCLEEMSAASGTSLLIKRKISVVYEKNGAMGIPTTAGGVDTYTDLPSAGYSYHLSANEDAVIKRRVSYFLFTNDGRLLPATKLNFRSLFAQNRENIDHYLDTHKINFNKETDLLHLFSVAAAVK